MNEKGICCDSYPSVCPEGQYLINVDGCYDRSVRNRQNPTVVDDDDDILGTVPGIGPETGGFRDVGGCGYSLFRCLMRKARYLKRMQQL